MTAELCRLCGNGEDDNEDCDDGNVVLGDGCDPNCEIEVGYECSGYPSIC